MIRGLREARDQDPFHQLALETPAYSALRKDGQMIKYFGEGIVVQRCAYGGRLTGKGYRFWISAETLEVFLEHQILPKDKASLCKACKANRKHRQAACPQKGDDRGQDPTAAGGPDRRMHDRGAPEEGEQGSCQAEAQLIKAIDCSSTEKPIQRNNEPIWRGTRDDYTQGAEGSEPPTRPKIPQSVSPRSRDDRTFRDAGNELGQKGRKPRQNHANIRGEQRGQTFISRPIHQSE